MDIHIHNGAQLTVILLSAVAIGISLSKDGEPKKGFHSFLWDMFGMAINLAILYWGGFFS